MGPQPRPFHHSLDWRFLLPLADSQNICLLLQENERFSQTLEQVGMHPSQQLSVADLRQKKSGDVQCFVMPFGLPSGWVSNNNEEQVEFYGSMRRSMVSGGYALIGFDNVWNVRRGGASGYDPSTPQRVRAQLKQAGFHSIQIFGAMPNLAIPEYIFDLDERAIRFALQSRFRRKASVLRVLRTLSGSIGWTRLSNFLPCYFVRAMA